MSTKWLDYLHFIRKQEIEISFSSFNSKQFRYGLELGAGDGYQSSMLINYCRNLVCTELNSERLKINNIKNIEYKICDAEIIDSYFDKNQFDLVFSSNMFEHLPNPQSALHGIKNILSKDGIVILIMPSPFWAFCHLFLYYPVKILNYIKRKIFIKKDLVSLKKKINTSNNLKLKDTKKSSFLNLIQWPKPHGISDNHYKEFLYFKKKSWIEMFNVCGYEIINVKKGPITSGYGLNLNYLRCFLRSIGLTSEYIYYLKLDE